MRKARASVFDLTCGVMPFHATSSRQQSEVVQRTHSSGQPPLPYITAEVSVYTSKYSHSTPKDPIRYHRCSMAVQSEFFRACSRERSQKRFHSRTSPLRCLLTRRVKATATEELREAGQRKLAEFAERAAAAERQARDAAVRIRALESGQATLRVRFALY